MKHWVLLMVFAVAAAGAEPDANRILADLRARHVPYRTVLDPTYYTPEATDVLSYTRCGDSAIWTGHLLAAEAHRYAVTRSADALEGVKVALDGIRRLVDVTGNGLLARCAFPADSPYAPDLIGEERQHGFWEGTVDGERWAWIGNTSRDQYLGVFFGLTAAWNVVDDAQVRGGVRSLATRVLDNLRGHNWAVVMPDRSISTTFAARVDQQLMLLKLGRRADENRFGNDYRWQATFTAGSTAIPIGIEVLDPGGAYFKFNLDHIAFYGLLTGGDSTLVKWGYERAFSVLRKTTDDHGNAFFDVIERAVSGPDRTRDQRIATLLDEWLTRPRRDFFVDLRGAVRECDENRACDPIPVASRVRTDFLWQRSPFQLYGGGSGRIEGAGIDYLLPYWMARYYGVVRD